MKRVTSRKRALLFAVPLAALAGGSAIANHSWSTYAWNYDGVNPIAAPVVEGAWPRVATVTDPRPNQAMADLSPQGTAPEHLRARVVEKETQSFSPFASNDDAPGNFLAAAPAAAVCDVGSVRGGARAGSTSV